MSKKNKEKVPQAGEAAEDITSGPSSEPADAADTAGTVETAAVSQADLEAAAAETEKAVTALKEKEDQFLRLAAEYDNFRKRSQKEKENAWTDAKAETILSFLPVFDNLERALKAPCSDEAYAKGVEMTMNEFKKILSKLGVEEIPALGAPFDPNFHNAVMHVEDETVGENTIVEVFQTGFTSGDKVVRFAMVKVAN